MTRLYDDVTTEAVNKVLREDIEAQEQRTRSMQIPEQRKRLAHEHVEDMAIAKCLEKAKSLGYAVYIYKKKINGWPTNT